jgi:hypothetical protein
VAEGTGARSLRVSASCAGSCVMAVVLVLRQGRDVAQASLGSADQ